MDETSAKVSVAGARKKSVPEAFKSSRFPNGGFGGKETSNASARGPSIACKPARRTRLFFGTKLWRHESCSASVKNRALAPPYRWNRFDWVQKVAMRSAG